MDKGIPFSKLPKKEVITSLGHSGMTMQVHRYTKDISCIKWQHISDVSSVLLTEKEEIPYL